VVVKNDFETFILLLKVGKNFSGPRLLKTKENFSKDKKSPYFERG